MREAIKVAHLAGMPHLAYAGLSENWLLKECGQRHWAGIAQAHGLDVPRFADTSGRTAYAAFTAIRLSAMRLDAIREHDAFTVASAVYDASRSQHYSCHQLHTDGRLAGSVEMLSAFVQRLEAGNNQSVTRASIGPADDGGLPDEAVRESIDMLQRAGKGFRTATSDACMGLHRGTRVLREFVCSPCPNSDFNGASFMYFASFQALVERAEWVWFRRRDLPRLEERQLYFHGNVNVGDEVMVQLLDWRDEGGGIAHWCRIVRGSDDVPIADVITRKRAPDEP